MMLIALSRQLHLQILLFLWEQDLVSIVQTCHALRAFQGHKQLTESIVKQRWNRIGSISHNKPSFGTTWQWNHLDTMLIAVYQMMPCSKRAFHIMDPVPGPGMRTGKTTLLEFFVRTLLQARELDDSIV